MQWEPVIGLEIHAQLATRSKIFSGASTAYGAEPNTQACAVDLGLPGVLPVLNAEAVRMAVLFGLAVGGNIAARSVFARKNYFYPDLPKGYQISQYELPIVSGGRVEIPAGDGGPLEVGITRAHLEEDAGKSLHDAFQGMTGIDLNRAGTPLIEIVSEPDMRSAAQAAGYMRKIHALVRWLGICDGNMQEGSFRCDANVSVRPAGSDTLGTRTELKNLNSFRFVERAIEIEIERQVAVLEDGGEVVQETRLYDEARDETRSMRGKEEADDYRYFPDPDLLPITIAEDAIEAIRAGLPELPDARRRRFIEDYDLGAGLAELLCSSREMADYFETAQKHVAQVSLGRGARITAGAGADFKVGGKSIFSADGDTRTLRGPARVTANWITGDLTALLNRHQTDIGRSPVKPEMLAGLLVRVMDETISSTGAKEVLAAMWDGEGDADAIIQARGLAQMSDSAALEQVVDEVISGNPDQVEQYRAGKTKVMGFLVGQVMKASGGKANPKKVSEILKSRLG